MSEERTVYDVAQARAAIEAEARERAALAAQEYDAFVEELQRKWHCLVVYHPSITPDGRIVARPMIAPQ